MFNYLLIIPFIILIILLARRVWISADAFMKRGIVGGFTGAFIGWIVLFFVFFLGKPTYALIVWMFISFPFILGTLVITGRFIGWILSKISQRIHPAKTATAMAGIVIGGVLGAMAAGMVARGFDYLTLKDFQLEIYGYYFVGCAAIIGATSGAIAGATAGLTKREI